MSEYILVYTHPKLGRQRFALEPHRSYRLGAHGDNDIVIPQKDISRHHAVLTTFDGRFQITDLSSKNGTSVNGQRIASGEVRCGDQLGISSAALLIVEVRSEEHEEKWVAHAAHPRSKQSEGAEDTGQFRLAASAEDIVDLLETTSAAVGRGAVTEPLRWAVERLGLEAAVVLYSDLRGGVSMVASAGDLGPLLFAPETLLRLAAEVLDETPTETPRLRQLEVQGEQLLLGRLGSQHVLLVRYAGHPPAVTDLRAMIAATVAVLGSASHLPEASPAAGQRAPGVAETGDSAQAGRAGEGAVLSALLEQPLSEAREGFERLRVERALAAAGGSCTAAATMLGISRAGLYKLARRLGLP